MTHKFVIELVDDCKGYEQDVDYLERVYGAEPIKEHDEEIYNKAIDDFSNRLSEYLYIKNATKYGNKDAEQQRNIYDPLFKYQIADAIDDVAQQLKAGGSNEIKDK